MKKDVQKAIAQKNTEALKSLLKSGISEIKSIFSTLCKVGYIEAMEHMVESYTTSKLGIHDNTDFLLRNAVMKNQLDVVEFLLVRAGAKISADNFSALNSAAYAGFLPLVQFLVESPKLKKKSPVKHEDYEALSRASMAGHMPVVDYLMSKIPQGANLYKAYYWSIREKTCPNYFDKVITPDGVRDTFIMGCIFGRTDVVEYVLKKWYTKDENAVLDAQTFKKGLEAACGQGYIDVVKILAPKYEIDLAEAAKVCIEHSRRNVFDYLVVECALSPSVHQNMAFYHAYNREDYLFVQELLTRYKISEGLEEIMQYCKNNPGIAEMQEVINCVLWPIIEQQTLDKNISCASKNITFKL